MVGTADPAPVFRRIAGRVLGLAGAAVTIVAVVVGAGLTITRTAAGAAVTGTDLAALRWLAERRTPTLDTLSAVGTDLASAEAVIGLGIAVAVMAAVVVRRVWPAALMVVALAGETQLFVAAASAVGRTRPPVPRLDGVLPPTASFPSGHTAAAICLYGGAAAIVVMATRRWWRWAAVAVAAVAVLVVAASRLYRAAHHPSDVLGSVLLALPWLLAVAWAVRGEQDRRPGPQTGGRRS